MKECKNCKNNNCCFLALACIPYDYKYHEFLFAWIWKDFKLLKDKS